MYSEYAGKNQPDSGLHISAVSAKTAAVEAREFGTREATKSISFILAAQEFNGGWLPDCLASDLLQQHTPYTRTNTQTNNTYTQHENERPHPTPRPPGTRGKAKLSSDQLRYKSAVEAMNDIPHAMEFSLNFPIKQEGSFLSTPDPVDLFERRINKYLRKYGLTGTPFAFAFDANDEQRLHAHGVIVVKPELQEAVKLALRHAGGFIEGRAGSRQLMLKRDADRLPAGWHAYTTKSAMRVRKLFQSFGVADRTSYVSPPYRRLLK